MEITDHQQEMEPTCPLRLPPSISCAWTESELFKDPQEINEQQQVQQMQGGKQPQQLIGKITEMGVEWRTQTLQISAFLGKDVLSCLQT